MSDATTNDKSVTDLKFNGRKVMFTAWKARIIAHLNSKSTEDDYKRVMDDKKPLNLAHSDWLQFKPIINDVDVAADMPPSTTAASLEAEKMKRFYYLRMQESLIRSLFGKVLPNEFLIQLPGTINNPDLNLSDVWARLEREYAQSSLDVSTTLYLEFITLPTKPFKCVSDLIKRMRSLQNQLNELYSKNIGVPLISDYQISQAVVAALPHEYFGSNVNQTTDGFKLSTIETLVKQVFSDKSSEAIANMSSKRPKREVHVNQAKVHRNQANKRKSTAYSECFYCHGTANVDGKGHLKADCALLKSDLSKGIARKNFKEVPAKRIKVSTNTAVATAKGGTLLVKNLGQSKASKSCYPDSQSKVGKIGSGQSSTAKSDDPDSQSESDTEFSGNIAARLSSMAIPDMDELPDSGPDKWSCLTSIAHSLADQTTRMEEEVSRLAPYLLKRSNTIDTSDWVLDSGCGMHMTPLSGYFCSYITNDDYDFEFGQGSCLGSTHIGIVQLFLMGTDKVIRRITLNDTLEENIRKSPLSAWTKI
ncbi:hypothetical protein DYB30_008290 [Aphanomyces astaci]|uniref:Retrovirus-related Pol polyprotein from transposon TNT 1-94-like beta-barrel domain-containing protein n=1 Tax=Aphanomyces astaci TaxID=112090 RepID=A0A397D1H3_APHAT|nr:hypothetical protein DYB30_008290 [Aphanomyces astaci]